MAHAVIERFKALDSAFHARANRSERLAARFAALASINSEHDIDAHIERSFELRQKLNERLGAFRAPSSTMRLVYAAALASADRSAKDFFLMRAALATTRKQRGGRALSQGGSVAALALTVTRGDLDQTGRFFDTLEAVKAPWWRREATREEVLAATTTALGETPVTAQARLSQARDTLSAAGVPRSHAEAAAYEVAWLAPDPGELASAWTVLNTAVRGRGELRHGLGKTGLAILAAHGPGHATADALVESFETVRALKPKATGQVAARIAMRLAQAQIGQTGPIAAARDLAAILAAQAAMIAAVTASTTAATVAATS